jgi:hypothetical protein
MDRRAIIRRQQMKTLVIPTRVPSSRARLGCARPPWQSVLAAALLGVLSAGFGWPASQAAPRLKVSENRRFLVYEDGRPFFYLADTAWELFHRLNREEADRYLGDRASKRFTVIQAVALAELDGLNDPNPYGHRPLVALDPTRPDVTPGPDNDYWDHVDYIIDRAESLGLTVGLLPTWGDKWNKKWGVGPEIFTPANAEIYGAWLGQRYRDRAIIWILGGDRPVETDGHRAIMGAMAKGLRQGDGGRHLMTFHPTGGQASSKWFHGEGWLDFNMWQNGHGAEVPVWERIGEDYARQPVKPVMDGEPIYEDHPIGFNPKEKGYSTAIEPRRFLYWDLFAGAHGHTYGNHAVWQMYAPRRKPVNGPLLPWYEAIQAPGAGQMQHARALLESRPFLSRIPDPSLIVAASVNFAVPGAGLKRLQATRCAQGTYGMVYVPAGRAFTVDLEKLSGTELRAWWFNPRDGRAEKSGEFPRRGTRVFTPPQPGDDLDWVLVLDDVSQDFPPPGALR